MDHTTKKLSDLQSLNAEQRAVLMKSKGIMSVEMLISLSAQPEVFHDLCRTLKIEKGQLEAVLAEAKALVGSEETQRLCHERKFEYQLGAILEDE